MLQLKRDFCQKQKLLKFTLEIFIPDSVDEIGIWNYKEAYKIYMNNYRERLW